MTQHGDALGVTDPHIRAHRHHGGDPGAVGRRPARLALRPVHHHGTQLVGCLRLAVALVDRDRAPRERDLGLGQLGELDRLVRQRGLATDGIQPHAFGTAGQHASTIEDAALQATRFALHVGELVARTFLVVAQVVHGAAVGTHHGEEIVGEFRQIARTLHLGVDRILKLAVAHQPGGQLAVADDPQSPARESHAAVHPAHDLTAALAHIGAHGAHGGAVLGLQQEREATWNAGVLGKRKQHRRCADEAAVLEPQHATTRHARQSLGGGHHLAGVLCLGQEATTVARSHHTAVATDEEFVAQHGQAARPNAERLRVHAIDQRRRPGIGEIPPYHRVAVDHAHQVASPHHQIRHRCRATHRSGLLHLHGLAAATFQHQQPRPLAHVPHAIVHHHAFMRAAHMVGQPQHLFAAVRSILLHVGVVEAAGEDRGKKQQHEKATEHDRRKGSGSADRVPDGLPCTHADAGTARSADGHAGTRPQ